MKQAIVLALLALAAGAAAAKCPAPEAVAKVLYESHYFFYAEGAPAKLFTPAFNTALRTELDCMEREQGQCSLGYDPWLAAQDGEAGKPLTFTTESLSDDVAIVAVRYPFVLGTQPPQPHAAHLTLRKDGKGCWLVDDLITPLGESLARLFASSAE